MDSKFSSEGTSAVVEADLVGLFLFFGHFGLFHCDKVTESGIIFVDYLSSLFQG